MFKLFPVWDANYFNIKWCLQKVKSRQTTTSQPNSRQFSGPVAPCVFVFPPWRVSCVLCNLVKMASPDREWFRAAIPENMLETLVIQTCVFLQEEDWGSIVPPERWSISFDPRKQQENFRSKEKNDKKGSEEVGSPKRTSPAQENDPLHENDSTPWKRFQEQSNDHTIHVS